jgi:lipid A 4'-phosphatase
LRLVFLFAVLIAVLAVLVVWPQIDLVVSGWFYRPDEGFFAGNMPLFDALHVTAHAGSRIFGFAAVLLAVLAASQRRPVLGLESRAWTFLFLGLLLGPGLVANGIFKDHWGRARPRDIAEFGGAMHFTPALVPTDQCRRNCSFVSGDGAFGFYLPAIAYVVPPARTRRYFWTGMGLGALFGLARIAAGAHFLSDVVFAAVFVQLVLALLYAVMFDRDKVRKRWRHWMFLS